MSGVDASPRFWDRAEKEAHLQEFASIGAPLTAHDTITRGGDYLRSWRLEGVAFEAADPTFIGDQHEALCNMVCNLPAGQCAVYNHRIQRKITDRLTDAEAPAFSAAFSRWYQDSIVREPMMSREIYLTLMYRPYPSDARRKMARGGRTRQSIAAHQAESLEFMEEKGAMIERTLRSFGPSLLGSREDPQGTWWEAGELYAYLINGVWRKVRFPAGPAWKTLPDARVIFGGSRLEIRTASSRRYAAMLDIKEFDGEVEPGTLGALLYESTEFIETQSFFSLPRRQGLAALTLQRNQLMASDDVAVSQVQAMDEALDALADGQFQMGEYAYSLAVFGDSLEQASKKAASAVGAIAETSAMELVPVDLIADAAWFAQQPGNFRWRSRKASITSRAFAALGCAHNFLQGKRDGNPWGEALALMRTPAGQPHYLNLHASPVNQDSEGKMLPGSTVVIGQTGSGKTTLVGGLLALTRKFPKAPRLVSFSLYRDTEILLRALGGTFYTFDRNVPTGLNPLQRPATPARLAHWVALVKWCLEAQQARLLPHEEASILSAVQAVSEIRDPRLRTFTALRQNLSRESRDGKGNSLFDRFGRWCRGGEHGWVFDMAPDRLTNLHAQQAIGFDYTGVADSPDVKTPIMMELLHVMDDLINGEPLIYHVAEAWKALADPIFAPFIKTKQKTIRKMNGLGIFDTQEVGDLMSNENGRTMVEQSATKLMLPNSDATWPDYGDDGLDLTRPEFQLLKRLGAQGSRRFLCKQGDQSVQLEYDLTGADDMLTVLSGTLENVELLDEIRAEVGDDPDVWLPILYQRTRQRVGNRRKAA
jgi:type IV secretion system protein VirB4